VTQHPWTAATIAGVLLLIAVVMTHWMVKTLRRWLGRIKGQPAY